MPPDSRLSSQIDARVLEQLVCPACLGGLRLEILEEARLVCAGCGRGYPIVDGIPVLIAERAVAPEAKPE